MEPAKLERFEQRDSILTERELKMFASTYALLDNDLRTRVTFDDFITIARRFVERDQ